MFFLDKASQNKTWGGLVDAGAILFFLFFVLSPLLFIFTKLGSFTFTEPMLQALLVSFSIAAAVTAIDLLFGIPVAWLLARKSFPMKGLVDTLVDLPLIIPTSALGLSIALFWGSQGAGLLAPGIGMIIALHVAFTFSYVVRTVQASLLELDSDIPRAASTLGASPLLSFRTIWLPLARAGVVSGMVLAFTRSLGETGATMIVAGSLMTVPVLTVYFKNSSPPDMDAAISLSMVFLLVSSVMFFLVRRGSPAGRFRLGKVYADAEKRLSGCGWLADTAGILFLFFMVMVPSFYFLKFSNSDIFSARTLESIGVSFAVAGAATAITIIFGLPLALTIASKGRGSAILGLLVEMSLLVPTVTIGLSLSLFWSGHLPEMAVLVLAHVAMVFSYFVSPVSEVLRGMDKNQQQAARSLGATPFYAFRTIVLPIIKPTLIAGIVVAFMRSVSETGGTLAVSDSITTIPILIVNLTKAGNTAEAASAAILLLAISLVSVALLRRSQAKKR
jgi:thiamine transport system permease protein